MGGCFSVSLSCDQMADQACQWLCLKGSYVHNLPENLSSLEKAMGVLKAKRDDLQRWVNREEFTGSQCRLAQVESYRYGKNVIMMLREVESLSSESEFDVVAEAAPVAQAEEMSIHPTIVGQETLLETVWNHLMDFEIVIVGLYGMGGVGKTTLLTQINNKFCEKGGRFDIVIWVVVSNGATIHRIQGEIGGKLGLKGDEWDQKNENERARGIYNVLRRQKFVLLLDDIWEKVNLQEVGVPNPTRENKCKVAFTTRSREVCGRMGVDDPIKVNCLESEKASELFQKKVGVNTLKIHPDIPNLARKIVSKCRGLPLALNVIGETMACKTTIEEWHHAIDVLTSSAVEFSGMENEILPILKYSYDNLSGDHVKSCFLYCALFPEDYEIDKKRLIEYWISEGFIDENNGIERALNQGYGILGILIRACLLLEGTTNKSIVSMHDVVREMALWISSDLGKHKDQCIVQAGVGLREIPKVKNWKLVRRLSLMENKIEKIVSSHECPQLTTLLLHRNFKLVKISGEFFRSMPKLLVLDLSANEKLDELPEEVSELAFLRYLDLSNTNIERLPFGLQALKMLIYLNLESTSRLESLNGISKFSSLMVIRLKSSSIMFDMSLMKEFELLEHLECISINISSRMVGEQRLYDSKVGRCIQSVCITELPKESTKILILPAMVNLSYMKINECAMWEIQIAKTIWNISQKSPCFSNLSSLIIQHCNGLEDLTWLLFAPNLTHLQVGNSKKIEAIISKEKAASVFDMEDETCKIIPFQKLEILELWYVPYLKSIYWSSLPFPCLKRIEISGCISLRKLPLNSQSVVNVEEFVIYYGDDDQSDEPGRIEDLEWEDEAAILRFYLPSSNHINPNSPCLGEIKKMSVQI